MEHNLKRKTKSQRSCVYCGTNQNLTREHVVARCFFPEQLPPNTQLVTVPSCMSCNGGISIDEEYVRATFCSMLCCGSSPAVQQTTLHRNLINNRSLVSILVEATELVPIYAPDGNYAFHWPSLTPDWSRVERVVRKIIRGLYYHETRQPLPDTDGIFVFNNLSVDQVRIISDPERTQIGKSRRSILKGTFEYAYDLTDADETFRERAFSYWILSFYDGYNLVAVTHPSDFDARNRWPHVYNLFHGEKKQTSPN